MAHTVTLLSSRDAISQGLPSMIIRSAMMVSFGCYFAYHMTGDDDSLLTVVVMPLKLKPGEES